ncbi:signal peptidase I [Pengzhenrongella frigida]|uniref:signal peptidase I n=1 Tax=Pengzhenrongella frigida TaxID=1259133 RepID=UPI0013EC87B6|nr:signal peptidase I [Cellulomonas sp. HLT2-17]
MKRAGAVLLLAVVLAIAVGGATAWSHGYRPYAVRTGSMSPSYPTGALVVDVPPSPDGGAPGSVITFRTGGGLVTHRIVETSPAGLTTKGDANPAPDAWTIPPENVIGRVIASVPRLGYVLVFFKQPLGVVAVMTGLWALILLWQLFLPEDADAATTPTVLPV